MREELPKYPSTVTAEFEIQLRDVLIFARHGVLPEETSLGNQYRVNVRLHIDASDFEIKGGGIDATVSYAEVYEILQRVMAEPEALLETVAVKFAKELRGRWQNLKSGEIEIVKTVPPIPGMIGEAGIRYIFS